MVPKRKAPGRQAKKASPKAKKLTPEKAKRARPKRAGTASAPAVRQPFRFDRGKPSTNRTMPWLAAAYDKPGYPEHHLTLGGKWLIFLRRANIDEFWEKVKAALADGQLGTSAKVSTLMGGVFASDPSIHVICVYTYNSDDEADVMRVRDALKSIGILRPINYKTDGATYAGEYKATTNSRVSRYTA